MKGTLLSVGVAALSLLFCTVSGSAARISRQEGSEPEQTRCDSRLKPKAGASGYQMRRDLRGNRCEGFYQPLVTSTSALSVVSLTLAQAPVAIPTSYQLSWPTAPTKRPVALRISTFGPDIFYRLDLTTSAARYEWFPKLLSDVGAPADSLAITATTEWEAAKIERVYLPVSLHEAERSGRYTLKLLSQEDLVSVASTITALSDKGAPSGPATAGPSSNLQYEVSDEPLKLSLDLAKLENGYYRIVIAGTLRRAGAGATTLALIIRHARQ